MLDLGSIRALTFDCYGTLVDWEKGIGDYVTPLLLREAPRSPTTSEWFARWEAVQFEQLSPWQPYSAVLTRSFEATMRSFALPSFADGGPGLVRSLGGWPLFADTVPALRRLARRRRLGIVSNIDRVLIAETLGQLLLPLAAVVTAEDVNAYKPDPKPFVEMLARLGLPPEQVLHAAFGWRYDLGPARQLGIRTCRVDRTNTVLPPDAVQPDLEVPSLAALAEALDR